MSDRAAPPKGWYLTESQNLYRPFSCEQIQNVTSSYATEAEAIAAAWDKAEDDPITQKLVEATALLKAIADTDALRNEDEELDGEVHIFLAGIPRPSVSKPAPFLGTKWCYHCKAWYGANGPSCPGCSAT
jgi:hypothetical protein